MSEKPILFSGPMVRAILERRKTQTRCVVTVPWGKGGRKRTAPYEPVCIVEDGQLLCWADDDTYRPMIETAPYAVGDRLWVRETWAVGRRFDDYAPRHLPSDAFVFYREGEQFFNASPGRGRWRPSIHMPRWASRITLRVTGVGLERVQDITKAGAVAEGVDPAIGRNPHRSGFVVLWDTINAARGFPWDNNPWVWVYEFRRVEP